MGLDLIGLKQQDWQGFDSLVYIFTLIAILLAAASTVSVRFQKWYVYLFLYKVYLSVVLVGGVYFQYQWDTLLLEAGFLAVFVCPKRRGSVYESDCFSTAGVELLKWLFFRVMF